MKKDNLTTGRIGEEIAKEYLEEKGYKILDQNYKTKYGEIDLICQDGEQLVVVEVRTKKGEAFGSPEQSLTKKKLKKIWFNARIQRADRIDAVCIVLKQDNAVERLNHYQNII